MVELVQVGGVARGIIARNLISGEYERHAADAVLLCTGGYGNVFRLSTNAQASNVTASWRCHRRGAFFANPCYTQIHPTCIPVSGDHQSKLTLMSESLRNDGRVWVPSLAGDERPPSDIPEGERDYYLERRYPSFGNLVPRDVASRAAKRVCDDGFGVGATGTAVYLDFADAIGRDSRAAVEGRYGNLFQMYEMITGEDPYRVPMRIFPAVHYTMGGLWVDYNLQTTIPGLFALGEANFSDHGANRLGASALMQGLADGTFVIPATITAHLAGRTVEPVGPDAPAFGEAEAAARERDERILSVRGGSTVSTLHRELGLCLWNQVGMSRTEQGLREAIGRVRDLRERFWNDVRVPGEANHLNPSLEHAGRLADFLEFAELLATDALQREESCGGHFREEHQTGEGEALRNDEAFCHVAAWEHDEGGAVRHEEPLSFEEVHLVTRSYK
jgi:succinate dehydrogenase / fumarate reductase flavoprotein subunit